MLVGTSAVGLNDIKTTPVSPAMPGVEIHAQVLEAALTRTLLSQPPYGPFLEFIAALLLGVLVVVFAPMFGPVTLAAVGALFATFLIGTSWYFYTPATVADRFYLSLAVYHLDLPHLDLCKLRAGAGAAAADSFGVQPVFVAGAGPAVGPVAGKARARRRGRAR